MWFLPNLNIFVGKKEKNGGEGSSLEFLPGEKSQEIIQRSECHKGTDYITTSDALPAWALCSWCKQKVHFWSSVLKIQRVPPQSISISLSIQSWRGTLWIFLRFWIFQWFFLISVTSRVLWVSLPLLGGFVNFRENRYPTASNSSFTIILEMMHKQYCGVVKDLAPSL